MNIIALVRLLAALSLCVLYASLEYDRRVVAGVLAASAAEGTTLAIAMTSEPSGVPASAGDARGIRISAAVALAWPDLSRPTASVAVKWEGATWI